jgi:nucleoside-diphosphate-sugar epimerase
LKTALVTGASGFIGRRLCAALAHDGARVRALVRDAPAEGPWHESIRIDLATEELPANACDGVDVIFHFAGKAHAIAERPQDDADYRRINVDGTRRVLEAAARARVQRVIFASSVKAMGEGDGQRAPLTPYGQSKLDAEGLLLSGLVREPVVLRLSLVYGPGVGGNLDAMLRAVDQHRFPPPPRMHNRRSMVHVDDVVKIAIASAAGSYREPGPFVIGDGVAYSTAAIYDAMVSALGRRSPRWRVPAAAWRMLAGAGDAAGALMRRRAPFDSVAYHKLFGSAWYPPADVRALFGIHPLRTLSDALPEMVAGIRR